MKQDIRKALFSGVLVSLLVLSSSMICLFKSGVSAVVDTALLSIGLLVLLRGMNSVNVALSDIFARAFISGATTASAYLAILALHGNAVSDWLYLCFALVMMMSAGAGILFFSSVGSFLADQKYVYPQLKSRMEVLASPSHDSGKNRKLVLSTAFSACYGLLCERFSLREFALPYWSIPIFSNNLLYVSTGYFIGYSTWLKMLLGFAYSLIVFLIFPTQSFSEHITNPYIYSVVLAFSLASGGYAILEALRRIRMPFASPRRFGSCFEALVVLAALAVFYKLLFHMEPGLSDMPLFLIVLVIAVTLVSSMSTAIGVAETGFWFSILDDVLPVLVIALAQIQDMASIILLLAGFTSFEMAGVYYTLNARVGQRFAISRKTVVWSSILSCAVSSVAAILLVRMLASGYALGGVEYPVPNAKVLEVTVQSMMTAFTEFRLPSYLNLSAFIPAFLLCILLKRKQISPMNIIGGILLPFGAFVSLGVGALLSYALRRQQEQKVELFSGFAIGEGLVSTTLAFWSAR